MLDINFDKLFQEVAGFGGLFILAFILTAIIMGV